MRLFIDRFPLHCWTDNTRTPPVQVWSVRVPCIVTDAGAPAPAPNPNPQLWEIDTGYTGEAFAWRHHLAKDGVDPDAECVGTIPLTWSVGGQTEHFPARVANLWLVSNVTEFVNAPKRLELARGIALRNVTVAVPDPEFHRALIGTRALRRAGFKVDVDFAHDAVSIWIPDTASP